MEDLGHIDININDRGGAGGRGAGGAPGSGPSASTIPASTFAPLTAAQQALAQRVSELRQNITRWNATTARIGTARVGVAGEAVGELRDFFQRPTIAGFRSLTNNASATGSMLGRLAASSPRLALFATGLLGAAGIVTTFIGSMKRANEAIKERIVELTKYSSELALASAQEQIAQLGRDLREVHENGRLYAAAQRLDTFAANDWAKTMVDINKMLAVFGAGWSIFKIGAASAIRFQMFQLTLPQKLAGLLTDQLASGLKKSGVNVADLATKALKASTLLGFGGLAGMLFGRGVIDRMPEWMEKVLRNLDLIKQNTAGKDLAGSVNDWFRADVQAMTGRPY